MLNGETSDTNDNVKTKINTKHMKPVNDVTHWVLLVFVVLRSHTHSLHTSHGSRCPSVCLISSMHEVSVSSDFHDLFITFIFFLSFLINLKQFLLPFNGSSRMWITTMPQSVRCSSMHTENKSITPSEKACLLVSRRRPCPIDRGNHDRSGQHVVERGQELNTEHAQIRTLLDRQREQILADCLAEIRHHEFQANYDRRSIQKLSETIGLQQEELHRAQAEELHRRDQQLLHEQLLKQNWDLREAHQKSLKEMKELNKFQSSTFDTIARRRSVEDQDTILQLTGKIHDLQTEINCMNDSKYFQDAESIRSGQSHVPSQPVSFPPHPIPEGMLRQSFVSPSRREGAPSIWDTHGISGNVFCRSSCILFSTLSAGIESMEFSCVGTNSLINGGEE